jgi:hypothetical protein
MNALPRSLLDDQESWRADRLARYQDDWSAQAPGIRNAVANGMPMRELVRLRESMVNAYRGFIPDFIAKYLPDLDLGKFAEAKPPHRLAVSAGRYVSAPTGPSMDAFTDAIARCVDPDVDCVVEFGSGLGFNLALLRLRLPTAPLTYLACEPSEAGRQAAQSLFASDQAARLEAHDFDYLRPNLDCLKRFRKIVAFSVHSIEQIPVLGEDFYRMLLDANVAACVHVEPVGWQRFTNIAEAVMGFHHDPKAWQRFFGGYKFVLEDQRVVDNAAMWSIFCGYNTDLLPLISAAAARGEVALTNIAYDVIGLNPFNPSTLVSWRRNR